jgi:hypothetical protein
MLELIELLFRIWIHPGSPIAKPIGPEHWRS